MPTQLQCPHCGQAMAVSRRLVGHTIPCRHCGRKFRVAVGGSRGRGRGSGPPTAALPPQHSTARWELIPAEYQCSLCGGLFTAEQMASIQHPVICGGCQAEESLATQG